MAKVVSILSAGHSGSTLLDMVCGSINGVFSLGEVTYLPWQLYRTRDGQASVQKQNVCTCRKRFQDCLVWSEVVDKLSSRVGYDIQSSPFKFTIALASSQRYKRGRVNPMRFLRIAMLTLFKHRIAWTAMLPIYWMNRHAIYNNWLLFDELSSMQKASYLVDSTKNPCRLWFLQKHRPNDVRVLVLIRDVRAVAYSAIRRYGHDGFKRAAGWVRTYNHILDVLVSIPDIPVQIVLYEDLCADPEGTRTAIADFLGLKNQVAKFPLESKNYHMIAGNPMRYIDSITVRSDDAWEKYLDSEKKQKIIEIAQELNPAWRDLGYVGVPFCDATKTKRAEGQGSLS